MLVSKLGFATTPIPDSEPWIELTNYLDGLEVEEYFFGLMFLAWGVVKKL